MNIIKNIVNNRRLVLSLSVNDFKTKYSGSQFGIIWAFVQPVVTIFIYIFVFQVISKANPIASGFPFVLWLIAGMIPWFFFSESVVNGTTALIEYSYLVKKVVFNIQILPVVRVLSAIFVHAFFVLFTIVIFIVSGYMPTVYYLQIIYYMFCCIALTSALSYITAAIMPFFRDFLQLVNIFLMLGMWACPVMWDYQTLIPLKYQWIIRINPVFYIIQGYRDSFLDGVWFWQKPADLVCFWLVTILILIVGCRMFSKLSVHFADVL